MTNFTTYFTGRAHNKNLFAEDMVLYCLHKARLAKNEDKVGLSTALLKRAFSPITNRNKLDGGNPYRTLNQCVRSLEYRLTYGSVYNFMCAEEKLYYVGLIKQIGRF